MLRGQTAFWHRAGYDVAVVSSPGRDLDLFASEEGAAVYGVPIEREPSPWKDLRTLVALWRLMRRLRPSVVECGTPKAGLLGGLAAWLAGVPARVYTLHGLRLETLHGWRRAAGVAAERVATAAAHEVLAVSPSLLRAAQASGAVPRGRGAVAGPGTANGVDLSRFELAAPPDEPVVGFVGRFTRDKGVETLLAAFDLLAPEFPNLRLLMVGDFEAADAPAQRIQDRIAQDPSIEWTGFVDDAAPYYARMNVVALPSRREGFPLCALEAAAAARPLVAARSTGTIDAVIHDVTGVLVPADDPERFAAALARLLRDREASARMGASARRRAARTYRPESVWVAKQALYLRLRDDAVARRLPLQRAVKRAIDIAASATGLLLCAPGLALLVVLLRLQGAPALFRQDRPGHRHRLFTLYKLRTMTDARDGDGEPLPDALRVTALGAWLRRWSLDELPQLWNVLRGEMSLVGPRPLLAEYLPRYSRRQRRRGLVKPGLTGWAQVRGRNDLDWDERLELDAWYAEHWNLVLDLRILIESVAAVLSGRGVTSPNGTSPEKFLGA